ncbi:integrase [Paraburkholderia sp. WC7.3g]
MCCKLLEHRGIDRWIRRDLAHPTLSSLRGADFAKYRDERRLAGRAENTIRLELQIVSHLFEMGLSNPLTNIRKPTGSQPRDRRLRPGEFEKLCVLLSASGNRWAAPACELAIETSLRQGAALFSVRWEWLDIQSRMIKFPPDARGTDNKSVPPALPLSRRAINVLRHLAAIAEGADTRLARSMFGPANADLTGLKGRVFGTTTNAIICVWKRTIKSASIEDPIFILSAGTICDMKQRRGYSRKGYIRWKSLR